MQYPAARTACTHFDPGMRQHEESMKKDKTVCPKCLHALEIEENIPKHTKVVFGSANLER
jgi:hypothetical protein